MKIKKKLALIGSQLSAFLMLGAGTVMAQANTVTIDPIVDIKELSVAGIVNTVVTVVFGVGILVCVVFLIIYGIKYITAGDDVKQIEGARKGITGAIIGLAIIILTFVLIKFVATLLGVKSDTLFNILPATLTLSQ